MDENKEMETAPSVPKQSSGAGKKLIIIGLPLFIVQIVAVYFIAINILLPRIQANAGGEAHNEAVKTESKEGEGKKSESGVEFGKFIYSIEDIILNPAGTDGKKIFLMSVSFDLNSEKDKEVFKEKEVMIKDAVISTTAAKNLTQLTNVAYRDTLRNEIVNQISEIIKDVKINRVYFSKFMIN